jgi:hypothetical protein
MLHNSELDGRISDSTVAQHFELLQPDLMEFAERHSLFVRKYVHNYPMWSFYFLHPSGGRGSVTLSISHKEAGLGVGTHGEWHVDDEASLTRSFFNLPIEYISDARASSVVSLLEKLLSKILNAPASARTGSSRIMPRRRDESGQPVIGDFERSLRIAT